MTVSLLLNRPRYADMAEDELSIHLLLLHSLLILFYSVHISHSISSQGCTDIEIIFA